MRRILITGARGFLGRHCLRRLADRCNEVHAVSSISSVKAKQSFPEFAIDVHWHQADLRDPLAARALIRTIRPTELLHLAWITTSGLFWHSEDNDRWLAASQQLIHEFALCGGQRIVVAGTCAEYEWPVDACSEYETLINPSTRYGIAKNELHQFLNRMCEQTGTSAAWARLFFLYGPEMSSQKFPAAIIAPLLMGQHATCKSGSQQLDYLYIADAARALTTLLESSVNGPINVASGIAIALEEMAYKAARLVGRTDLLHVKKTSTSASKSALIVAEVHRLRDELGFAPHYGIDRGLAATVAALKKRKGSFNVSA